MILYSIGTYKNLPRMAGANFFLILLVSFSISFTSCDESSVVGLDVQPANDLLNVSYIDTTTLFTKTVKIDSLRTDESLIITADALIGKYLDPVFGTATASLYTQLRLPTNAPTFGTSPLIDSVILALVYDTACYGKKQRVQQNVNVYEVTEPILMESSYFSNKTLTYNTATDLANNYGFIPKPFTSFTISYVLLKPQLRIPLNLAFGQTILDYQNNGGANLISNAAFQAVMKGLYITTEGTALTNIGDGNIMHFKMAEAQSKLILYYHNSSEPSNDSLKYDLSLGSVARFTHFYHDYSAGIDGNLATQLGSSPSVQNDAVFIQSMAGVKTKIEMPYIMNWVKSGPIAINKAELVIKVDLGATYQLDTFAAPARVVLFGINDDGSNYILSDYSEGDSYFGGQYNRTTHEYHFNIARYIQQVLTGKRKNNGLELLASGGQINANRLVIGGGGSASAYRMKLNISFTKLQ